MSFAQQGDSVEIIKIDTTNKVIEKVKDTKLSKEILIIGFSENQNILLHIGNILNLIKLTPLHLGILYVLSISVLQLFLLL